MMQQGAGYAGRKPAIRGLTLASLNTRGIPLLDSHLAQRYRVVADFFEASSVDIVCFQEAFTYHHLGLLADGMASLRYVSYRPSLLGPGRGLLTLSRSRVAGRRYQRFPGPSNTPGLSRLTRLKTRLKGTLVTRLTEPDVCILNTHPSANTDGDWSRSNRFYPLYQVQLAGLAQMVAEADLPVIVCDFDIPRESDLHQGLMADTKLVDAFDGGCPPTFHAEYLTEEKSRHCIDFILVSRSFDVEQAAMIFAGAEPLQGGSLHVPDHVGLQARVALRDRGPVA